MEIIGDTFSFSDLANTTMQRENIVSYYLDNSTIILYYKAITSGATMITYLEYESSYQAANDFKTLVNARP